MESAVLLDVCGGHGVFRWKNYGDRNNAMQRVLVLRGRLREKLGLPDERLHRLRAVDDWRAKVVASAEIADNAPSADGR